MDTGPAPNALQAYKWIARPGAQKTTAADTVTQATYYDYDLDGNVKNLYQQVAGLGIKRINYEYDLISGKVNFVAYQNGKPDQFYYQYNYDADNRITEAWTSIKADTSTYGFGSTLDSATQKMDASYQYYLHGPLARMELGDVNTKVQGVDYAYTLQGWLKGVNSQALNPSQDMGQDSATVAKDAYGYSLGYYTNDYKPIGGAGYTAFVNQYTQNTGDITGQSLYNGNISTATYAISQINSNNPVGYTYHYDQLNRIKHLRQHSSITSWSHSDINSGYSEDFTFDGNGNILSLLRSGTTSATKDSLIYKYNLSSGRLTNNQLNWLSGHGAATNMGTDQSANNYKYDPIGNLTDDAQSRVDSIHWSVYGKIMNMLDSTKTISYLYNTAQERVTKTANGLTTWYIRDAQGNTLALYDNKASQTNWREQHLYGSSRLGMWQPNVNLATNNAATVWDTIGKKSYELNNHLDNVVVTISDSRTSHTGFFTANIKTAQDYYVFGALMPGRDTSSANYRYGFNGKENDNEVKGTGNQQDYGMRIYDPRVGRFLSMDPLQEKFPEFTPYQFASNNPIEFIDLDGMEGTKSVKQHSSYWIFIHNLRKNGDEFFYNLGKTLDNIDEKKVYKTIDKTLNSAVNHPAQTLKTIDDDLSNQANEGLNDGITFLYYKATKQDNKATKLAARMVFKYGPMAFFPEERELDIIQGITRENEIAILAENNPKFWTKSEEFLNVKVFQRNDIFDVNTISTWKVNGKDVTGTNLERMASGRAPIGVDGKPVNLHHLIQIDNAGVAEVTATFHQEYSQTLHINPNTMESDIDRSSFNEWREKYWQHRAEEIKKSH